MIGSNAVVDRLGRLLFACPPGTSPVQIIDRIGRKGTRCKKTGGAGGAGGSGPGGAVTPANIDPKDLPTGEDGGIENGIIKESIKQERLATLFGSDVDGEARVQELRADFNQDVKPSRNVKRAFDGEGEGWSDSAIDGKSREIQSATARRFEGDDSRWRSDETAGGVSPAAIADRERNIDLYTNSAVMKAAQEKDPEKWTDERLRSDAESIFPPPKPQKRVSEAAGSRMQRDMDPTIAAEQAMWTEIAANSPDGKIKLYRGLDINEGDIPALGASTIQDYPASSWSVYPEVAGSYGGTIVSRDVGPDEIVGSFLGSVTDSAEGEVILYTPPDGASVNVVRNATGVSKFQGQNENENPKVDVRSDPDWLRRSKKARMLQAEARRDIGSNNIPVFSDKLHFACPPGTTPKKIIDRLGRSGTRCVKSGAGGSPPTRPIGKTAIEDTSIMPQRQRGESAVDFNERIRAEPLARITGQDPRDDDPTRGPLNRQFRAVQAQRTELGIMENASPNMRAVFDNDTGWGGSSLSGDSKYVQASTAEVFGDGSDRYVSEVEALRSQGPLIDPVTGNEFDADLDQTRLDSTTQELRASIEQEQAMWRDRLGEDGTITLYRGLSLPSDQVPELGEVGIQDLPASSWSMYPDLPSKIQGTNVVVARQARADEIVASEFSHVNKMVDGEVVLYTPPDGVIANVVRIPR